MERNSLPDSLRNVGPVALSWSGLFFHPGALAPWPPCAPALQTWASTTLCPTWAGTALVPVRTPQPHRATGGSCLAVQTRVPMPGEQREGQLLSAFRVSVGSCPQQGSVGHTLRRGRFSSTSHVLPSGVLDVAFLLWEEPLQPQPPELAFSYNFLLQTLKPMLSVRFVRRLHIWQF